MMQMLMKDGEEKKIDDADVNGGWRGSSKKIDGETECENRF